jgi:nucleotide-binding universal stress UspA family protein
MLPGMVPAGGYEEILTEQAQQWLAAAGASVPDGIEATSHISFNESFAQGLIDDAQSLGAEAIVLGAAGDGLIGRHSIRSVTGELLYSSPVPLRWRRAEPGTRRWIRSAR